jgi:hypothetical protein
VRVRKSKRGGSITGETHRTGGERGGEREREREKKEKERDEKTYTEGRQRGRLGCAGEEKREERVCVCMVSE